MNNKPYGMQTANSFFAQFAPQSGAIPKRKVEILAEANSLFSIFPFQKNISCGTFRIWKDLSRCGSWYKIWPFESRKPNTVLIAEGYPSYYWDSEFNLKTRNIKKLLKGLPKKVSEQIILQNAHKNKDSIDAFVLAFCAEKFFRTKKSMRAGPVDIEGWILGIDNQE